MQDLELIIKPSFYYLAALIIFIAMSLYIAASLPISIWVKLNVLLLVAVYGGILIWHFGLLKAKDSIIRIRRLSDGKWQVQSNQKIYEAILKGDSTVTTAISVLRFQANNKRWPITCVIFPDSLPQDVYRRMLVALRA